MEKLADACEQAAFEKDYDDSDGMDDYGDDDHDGDKSSSLERWPWRQRQLLAYISPLQ